jgi:hypothetical protein
VYEEGDVTVLWNQAVHTYREVTANWPDIIIKNTKKEKRKENMHTDRCGNNRRQKCRAKGSGKEVKIQECVYRDTTNVEPEMYDTVISEATGIVRKNFRKKLGSCTRKTFDRFTKKRQLYLEHHT